MTVLRLCVGDPVVHALRSLHGANIVRIPSTRVAPLVSVAQKKGQLAVRGELRFLLADPNALELERQIEPMAAFSLKQTIAIDLKFGLKVLAGLLQGFGIPLPPVQAAVAHATQISFTFQQVRRRFVDTNALGAALARATVSPRNPAAAIYFGKSPHRLLVIDSVLESRSFGIKVMGSKGASAAIDLGALASVITDELKVSHSATDESQIVFDGKRHLAFAFTCVAVELSPTGKVKALPPGPTDALIEKEGADPHELLSEKAGMLDLTQPPESDLEWYESQNLDSLRDALREPEKTKQRIARAVGRKGLDALITKTSLGPSKESPAITDILFLHGIMGAHLEGTAGRPWFSMWSMFTSRVAERIRLLADGADVEQLKPGDHLNMFYGTARTAWRDRGYEVWPVSYDWRKSIVACADGLHAGIEKLAGRPRADGTPRRIAIVAHSMGGVVASLYASRHPQWESRIPNAVFMGSPLKGSYAPFEAITGTYPFFKKLDMLALRSSLMDFQETSAGLPGLLALLPDNDLDKDLLDSKSWPGPAPLIPSQQVLDQVRVLQPQISASPLLARTSLLATLEHGTVASVRVDAAGRRSTGPRNGKGDGTVPARSSSCVAGAPTYRVTAEHSDIPGEWDAIVAATRILEGDTPNLPKIKPGDLVGTLPLVEAEAEASELKMLRGAAAVRARLDAGLETVDDVRWLLSTNPDAAPASPKAARPARRKKR